MAEGFPGPEDHSPDRGQPVLQIRGLNVDAGPRRILRQIQLELHAREVLGILGPSGAGKTTLLRCLNRLTDLDSSLRVTGEVLLNGHSIFAPGMDCDALRTCVGMLFQQPVVFPVSILRNVLFGARHQRRRNRKESMALAETALREAGLWDEVKERLHEPAIKLSTGQQQRLCLARTLAVNPEIILMDEPTSALDARSAAVIERLVLRLAKTRSIVLVTHNVDQARRVADRIIRMEPRQGAGEILECAINARPPHDFACESETRPRDTPKTMSPPQRLARGQIPAG
jgi:phosphate transport system ATP-binding protein